MAGISSGQILRLKEVLLLGNSLENKSVRTWGRAVAHDITKSQLQIAADGFQMLIDTSLVEPMAFNIGSTYNFIGEMACRGKLILRARIACCIDGMDMDLFDKALDVRRKYLQEEIFPEDQML